MLALDGKTYTLDTEMCVIADDSGARGIAGIMGGEDTGCSDATRMSSSKRPCSIRCASPRTGRKLRIISDARYRFERGVDPQFVCRDWSLRPN